MSQVQWMNTVIHGMKEIPQLPSEVPTDRSALEKVEFPPEGGMLTYLSGHDGVPYRGFPYFEIVEKIDILKKVSRAAISGLYHALKKHRFRLITLLPAVWVVKDMLRVQVYAFYRLIERTRIKPERYSKAIRELYRVFTIPRNERAETQELRLMLRDVLCMILEFDNAYRFRAQDWIEYLDQIALRTNPLKELTRVLKVIQTHEKTQEIKDTWTLLNMAVSLYLRFDSEFKEMLVNVLAGINKDEFRLSAEDKHYCVRRKDYAFNFMSSIQGLDQMTAIQRADKLIIETDRLNQEKEAALNKLEETQHQDHVELDHKFTAQLNQLVSQEEQKEHNDQIVKAQAELLKKFEEEEKELIDGILGLEQVKLREMQLKERMIIKAIQAQQQKEVVDQYQTRKDQLKSIIN